MMLTTFSSNLMPFFSLSPVEIAKIKPREILSHEIKYQSEDSSYLEEEEEEEDFSEDVVVIGKSQLLS